MHSSSGGYCGLRVFRCAPRGLVRRKTYPKRAKRVGFPKCATWVREAPRAFLPCNISQCCYIITFMGPLAQQIRDNTFRSYVWMAALTAIIGVLGMLISYFFNWGLTGTGAFLVVAGVINFLAYFFSDKIVLRATGAKILEPEQ